MNYLTDDLDSLTALPLGIWQSDNECQFDDLSSSSTSALHSTVHYDPVCINAADGSATVTTLVSAVTAADDDDLVSSNISKTYTELQAFPKQEPETPGFLPATTITNPFTDLTNVRHCQQNVATILGEGGDADEDVDTYSKEMILSVPSSMQFGEVISNSFQPAGSPGNQISNIQSVETICVEADSQNTAQRHVVRLTRNKAVPRGPELIAKELPVQFNSFAACEQISDGSVFLDFSHLFILDANSLKEIELTKDRNKASLKAVQKCGKTKSRSKQNKKRKPRDFDKESNVGDMYSNTTSAGKKGKSFGKAKFKAEKWNMVFQRKAFLIRYSDVDYLDSSQIWCVVNHKVIRKYLLHGELLEGKGVYKKTNRLAGWLCNEPQHYYPVEVIEIAKDYDEVTIIYPRTDVLTLARNVLKIEENKDEKASLTYESSNKIGDIMENKLEAVDNSLYAQTPSNNTQPDSADPWGTTLLENEEDDEIDEEIEED
uniref:General transcription factor 3C polypeptide 2 n=1 Tax=Syphacia muris TaxID=451379 RepID=A0A0N5AN61_9BILA